MRFLARIYAFSKANDGAAFVELALVTPLLLLVLAGAVDLGHAYYAAIEVTNAAHAGAEYGSQNPTDTTGMTAAAQQSAPDLTLNTPTVSSGCECGDGTHFYANCSTTPTCTPSGNVVRRVQVTTSVVYKTLMPWGVIPRSFTLSNTATIRGNN